MRRGRSGSTWRRAFAVLVATLLLPPVVAVAELGAAATRHEAESATISQGVVESNHAGFSGTGFVNLDNTAGSFVEFTVTAPSAGPASLVFRFANGTTTDRPMDISVNGTAAANGRSFAGTGAWTTWQTVTVNASLRAGTNTVRATSTTANGGPNVDALDVEVAALDDLQAENATISQGAVEANHAGFTGTGFVNYDNVVGSFVEFTVNAASAGPASLAFRFANGTTTDRPMDITVNGTVVANDRSFAGTGAWTTWQEITVNATLNAGNNTVRATAVTAGGGPNLDRLRTDTPDTEVPTAPGQPAATNVSSSGATISWAAATDNRGVTRYEIRNDANNAVLDSVTGTPPATSKAVALACATAFTVHVVARDAAGNTSAKSPTVSFTTSACGGGNNPGTPTQVTGGWTIPWDLSFAPDGTFGLVTERDHFRVSRVNKNGSGKTQVGTVPNSQTTDGEGGLMGVAFSPTWNGGSDQEVFFMHTSTDGNRVAKMSFNGTALSGYTAIVTGIRKNRFHNGGRIRFGPDGFLYVATGDSQDSGLAQDRNSLNGKILRVTKTGAAAPGNPFGTRIFSLGHRNPQGLAFDDAGRLWSAELGASSRDELNLIEAGKNYGWPTCEGNCNVAGMTNPKRTWGVAEASPSGIAFANGALFMASLRGERLWRIVLDGENVGTVTSHFSGTFGRLRAVVKVPGESAIWIGTTNADNNGGDPDGSDRFLRSNLS